MDATKRRIGIVGSGPMAGYTLRALVASAPPSSITVFEAADTAGCGMPYRAGMNADEMYCNAFSREIPAYTRHLATWLRQQPDAFLHTWGLDRKDVGTRAFYPRVLLGEYLRAEFDALCAKGRAAGHDIEVRTGNRVRDIRPGPTATICLGEGPDGAFSIPFDDVILATGHSWPRAPQIDGVALVSPWPYTNVTALPPTRLGILGSSLSAIDVLVSLAFEHGEFVERGGRVSWFASKGREDLRITMVSHNGIMPEPDFHYDFPYAPLRHITEDAVARALQAGADGLLGRVFGLLIDELRDAAPEWLRGLGPEAETVEGFARAYVRQRKELGGLQALRAALRTAEESFETGETQAHRYALLRGHERFEAVLDHLDDDDFAAFRTHLAPVFADCYAAIPHVSVRRVLALHDAGVLDLVATREGASFTAEPGGVGIDTIDGHLSVAAMIDARGQPPAGLDALPFPGLVASLVDPDAPLVAPYRLDIAGCPATRVYGLAMPQVLARNPFAQGLANCAALSRLAVDDLLSAGGRDSADRERGNQAA